MGRINRIISISGIATAIILSGCTVKEDHDPHTDGSTYLFSEDGSIPGMLNIMFSDEAAASIDKGASPESLVNIDGLTSIQRLFPYDSVFEKRQRDAGLHKWYTIFFDESIPRTKASDELGGSSSVKEIESVRPVVPDAYTISFNDPYASTRQWHINNTGTLYNGFISGADIDVVPVWQQYTAGSKDVIVGVIDSGIQYDHPDLNGVVIAPGANGSKSFFVSNLLSPYSYSTIDNHGTHVAGIIAAINNNGIGGCGIAGGSDGTGGVRILDCQAIGETSMLSSAFVWAANHGAVILNNSWNIKYDNESDVPTTTPSSYASAIDYFINNAGTDANGNQTGPMKGGLVLFSAGNDSRTKAQPSMYDKVVSVGATGPANESASYTNYGSWVDICAPGGNHNTYSSDLAQIYSTKAGSSYGPLQGTSMACPMVSGVAALLVSHFGGPGFTCDDLRRLLLEGANQEVTAKHSRKIGPLLDAYGSFTIDNYTFPPVESFQTITDKTSATVIWEVKDAGGNSPYAYKVALASDKALLENFDPFNLATGVKSFTVSTYDQKIGGRVMTTFRGLSPGTYWCTAASYGKTHRYSKGNAIEKIEIFGNRPPEITPAQAGPFRLKGNDSMSIDFSVSDPDGDAFTFSVDRGSLAAKWTRPSNNTFRLEITANPEYEGSYTASLKVSDNEGASAEVNVGYTIAGNSEPLISCEYSGSHEFTHNTGATVSYTYSDPDGDELTLATDPGSPAAKWMQDSNGTAKLIIDGSAAPAGSYTASITVSDPYGLSATEQFSYTILPNIEPIITASEEGPVTLRYAESRRISFTASDADGDILDARMNAGSPSANWSKIADNSYALDISGRTDNPGTFTATITVSDGFGGSASKSYIYTLTGNHPARVMEVPGDITLKAGEEKSIALESIFSDPDGDELKYSISTAGNAATASISGNVLKIKAPGGPGISTVTVSAADSWTDAVSISFRLRTYSNPTADVWPTRVSDTMYIAIGAEGSTSVKITNSTGKTVVDKTVNLTSYDIYEVDMSRCAPGVYTVSVTTVKGKTTTKIVKI